MYLGKIWRAITAVKNAIGNIIFIGLIVLVIVAIFSRDSVSVPDSAILTLDPSGLLVEQKRFVDPFEQLLANDEDRDAETLLRDVVDAIDLAREDERIKALALDLDDLQGGSLSQFQEIGAALIAFREAGKPVLTFAEGYSQSRYFLAAFADELYIDRDAHTMLGGVFITGIGVYPLYFKGLLDKLHVKYHVFRAGQYKDAAEVFMRDSMSERSREATEAYLSVIWDEYLSTIAERRDIDRAALVDYINRYDELLETADLDPGLLAEEQKLIDGRITREEWRKKLAAVTGGDGEDYADIGFRQYLGAQRPLPVDTATDKVAVIVARGVILEGEQPPGDVGADSMVELIRQAREDSAIKAVVVRIDSPGGSATASEYIRTELELTQEAGKPVVASMGGVAASGGYWIAATADRIYSSASTLTGSIGVFASIPTFEATLGEIGVHSDGVGTTELSGAFNLLRPLNPRLSHLIENSVERTYRKFLNLVSEGRGLTVAQVDKIAQGRVWAGSSATGLGLVDAIGGIGDAIESAAQLAEVDNYEVIYLEKQLTPREQFINQLVENVGALSPGVVPRIPPELRALIAVMGTGPEPAMVSHCMTCQVAF